MTLAEYMDKHRMSLRDAAAYFELSSGHISDLRTGKTWPRRNVAKLLRNMSDDQISLDDILAGLER